MDLYTLDSQFLKSEFIDQFQSLIWTERYNAFGDVTLVFPTDSSLKTLLVEGAFLWTPDSKEVMLIDTVSSKDGVTTVTGQTLTGFLANRMLRNTWQTSADSWSLTGAAGAICTALVLQMCMASGYMDVGSVLASGHNEVIPGLSLGPAATGTSMTVAVPYGTLYDGVKTVCDLDDIGFTMYPPSVLDGTGNLTFTTYRGLDRTTGQSVNAVVIFEPALDSFTDITELHSINGYKNAAYAWPNGMTAQSQIGIAFAPGASGLTGFARRTLMVIASDVNAADYSASALTSIMNQKAKDGLANNNYVRMTDGQLVPQNAFNYGTDYNLGDIIELRGDSDVAQKARVIEYIRSQDATGETAYPTLSVIS